jgi:peptidoglycan/LPS O-acetylase OafA/YrhL
MPAPTPPSSPPRWGLRPKAIFLGLAVDLGGTILVAIVLVVVGVVWYALRGQGDDPTAFTRTMGFRLIFLALGLALTGVGGFVTAHLAPGAEYRNTLAMAVISLALGALLKVLGLDDQPEPLWYDLASWCGVVPTALFGAYVRVDTRPRPPQR